MERYTQKDVYAYDLGLHANNMESQEAPIERTVVVMVLFGVSYSFGAVQNRAVSVNSR